MSGGLAEEFAIAAAMASPSHYHDLISEGVSREFLYQGGCRFGVVEIDPSADGLYQPAPGGRPAYVVPAQPIPAPWESGFPEDDPADLIAWLPSEPRRWWCRYGLAPILNPNAIERAVFHRDQLGVYSSPLAWLRAGGAGIVILSAEADLRLWLGGVPIVAADELGLGERIEAALRERPRAIPRVLVPSEAA